MDLNTTPRKRRRYPAARARRITTALSASAFVGLAGLMAATAHASTKSTTPASASRTDDAGTQTSTDDDSIPTYPDPAAGSWAPIPGYSTSGSASAAGQTASHGS